MRTSRNSRTTVRDHPFRSRFEGDADLFPLRQYMRCRDEFVHRIVVSLIQAGFLVALVYLGLSIHRAFERHGADAAAWIEPVCLVGVGLVMISLGRKSFRNMREAVRVRAEMKILSTEIEDLKDRA